MALTNPRNEVTVSGLGQVVSGIRTWVESSSAAHSAYRVDGDTWASMIDSHELGPDSGSYVMTASYVYDEIQNIYSEINSANSATSADMEVIAAALNDLNDRVNATSGKADKVTGATSGNFAALDEDGNLIDSGKNPSDFKTKQTAVNLTGSTIKTITALTQDANGEVSATFQDIRTASTSQTGVVQLKNSIETNESDTTKAVTPKAVKDAIDAAVSTVYRPAGTKTVAQLTSSLLVSSNVGNVYNITDSGVTTSDFVEGAGKPINAGDSVGVCDIGGTLKFDLLASFVDLSGYKTKQTAITSAAPNALNTVQSISQDANGELTINYQEIQSSTSAQKGVVQLATTIGATVASENSKAATEKAVRDAINDLNVPSKADKVSGATSGHLAMLDQNGNLKDSGKFTNDFATSAQGAKADSAVQSITTGGTAWTKTGTTVEIPLATSGAGGTNGIMSNADKTKLDAIAPGAEVNQNAFSKVKIGSSTIEADQKTDTLEIAVSGNLEISADTANDKVLINLPMMTSDDVNEILSLLS